MTNKPSNPRLLAPLLVLLAFTFRVDAGNTGNASEEPQLLKIKSVDANLVLEAEQLTGSTKAHDGSRQVDEESTRIWPLLNLNMRGSVFHPNLLEFSIDGDLGYTWENGSIRTVESPATDTTDQRNGTTALRRYDAQLLFLQEKDFPLSLSASHAITRRDYDFFRRVTVESDNYGANWSLKNKEWPLSIALSHSLEDIQDPDRPETDENTRALISLRNQRSIHDLTDLRYSLDDFRYEKSYYPDQHGLNHSIQLLDVRTFGNESFSAQDDSFLRTRLDYNNRNTILDSSTNIASPFPAAEENSSRFSANEELKLQHTEDLSTLYNYRFGNDKTDQAQNTQHKASIGVRHQLYESLESTADIHGLTTDNSGAEFDSSTRSAGAGFNESYTKKLGEWGRLTLDCGLGLDSEQRDSSGGTLSILNEDYALSFSRPTVLRHPGVDLSSLVITDRSGSIRYVESYDYAVVSRGDLVEIRRIVGGRIPDGESVLVDYNASAESSDQFSTALNNVAFRLDILDNILGVYGKHYGVSHSGGTTLLLEEINSNTVGVDMKAENFRAGVEYLMMDSNLLPYNSLHSFQHYNFSPFNDCSLGIDLDQLAIAYEDTDQKQKAYSYILNCRWRLAARFNIEVQGGLRREQGPILDQDLLMARTELEFGMGQMNVRLGYEIQNDKDSTEDRNQTLAYFRAARGF